MEKYIGVCLEHEHDWCVIPLHEDEQICARCGEIMQTQMTDAFEAADRLTELVTCGHEER